MLIHHTTHDHPRRPARADIWLDDPTLADEDEVDREEQDLDLTESGIIAQLGLRGLPDDSY